MWWGGATPAYSVLMLLSALQRSDQQGDVKPVRWGKILVGVLAFLMVTLVIAIYLAAGVYTIWQAWQTTEWSNIWSSFTFLPMICLPFVILIPLLRMGMPFAKQQELLRSGVQSIRDGLAQNDERLTPQVPLQPAPLAPSDLAAGIVRIGPLHQPVAGNPARSNAAVLLIVLPIFFMFVLLPLTFMDIGEDLAPFNLSFNFMDTYFFPFFPIALIAMFLVPMTVGATIMRLRNRRKGLYVTVDAQGIQWQRPAPLKGEVRIPWEQVRSLSRITISGTVGATSTSGYGANAMGMGMSMAYVLESPEAVLMWVISSLSKPEDALAAEAFLRTVVTRTGKPLRDMTGFANEIVQAGGNVSYTLANRLPGAVPTAAFAAYAQAKQSKRRPRVWIVGLVITLIVLLFGSLYGGGAWAQSYQPTYLAHLPTQIHAEKPLFHDDLTTPNDSWLTQSPSNDDYQGYAYANGGYQLSGNKLGNTVLSIYPFQAFGEPAAYEVTAMQSGTPQKDGGDGVGIIFDSSSSKDEFMLFDVTYTGRWQIYHYKYVDGNASDDWSYLDGGHSEAIHTGQGATNQLLLVVRGHYFLVYINGQFIETYNARYEASTLPTSGFAGVYLDDAALVGTFNNFSVYPVKPIKFPDWQYV